jgi:hypothetical protein
MNPFVIDPKTRLAAWKDLRKQIISSENTEEKINLALQFWKMAPLQNNVLDWDKCENWPTPWELLNDNRFCDSTLSLAVAYTLLLSDPETFADAKLILVTDRINHVQKIMVKTNNVVLNYGWLDVNQLEILKKLQTHTRWSFDGKQWSKY